MQLFLSTTYNEYFAVCSARCSGYAPSLCDAVRLLSTTGKYAYIDFDFIKIEDNKVYLKNSSNSYTFEQGI